MRVKKLSSDLLFSISAVLSFNLILQLVIYPLASRRLGAQEFGNAVYWMGIISSLAGAIGLAINHERLIAKKFSNLRNGDCIYTLLIYLVIADILFALYIIFSGYSNYLLGLLLAFSLNAIRNYSDVEFRLKLNYKGYLGYYLLLSLGYLIGFYIFYLTGKWILILCIGEAVPLTYAIVNCDIYKEPFKMSVDKSAFFKAASLLVASDFIYALLQYWDRIILLYLSDSVAVSIYYVGTLIGKTLILGLAPLGNLVLSYLENSEEKLGKKGFYKIFLSTVVLTGVSYVLCNVISPIFVHLFYKEYLKELSPIFWLLNLGQILAMVSFFMNFILLSVGTEKWQIILRVIYAFTMILFSIIGTVFGGITGLAVAVIVANLIQFVFIVGLILYRINAILG